MIENSVKSIVSLFSSRETTGQPYMCRLQNGSIFIHFFAGSPRFFGTYFDSKKSIHALTFDRRTLRVQERCVFNKNKKRKRKMR